LYNDALDKHIVIVSTSTLLATLRTIASIWKQENQNKNALEIARQSGDLYDKFKAFVDDLIDVGKKMDQSKEAYSTAMNKLVDGKGNLITRAEKLKSLGARASKSFDQKILERAGVEEGDNA
jgi:DNA recombination protein RmuC